MCRLDHHVEEHARFISTIDVDQFPRTGSRCSHIGILLRGALGQDFGLHAHLFGVSLARYPVLQLYESAKPFLDQIVRNEIVDHVGRSSARTWREDEHERLIESGLFDDLHGQFEVFIRFAGKAIARRSEYFLRV